MKSEFEDKRIEDLFHELRDEDLATAPAFKDSWRGAWQRRSTPLASSLRRISAVAAALVALGVVVTLVPNRTPSESATSSSNPMPQRLASCWISISMAPKSTIFPR